MKSTSQARSGRIPSYRLHKASGQAIVTLSGRDIYLGPHGSALSRRRYDRAIAEWLACGRQSPALRRRGASDPDSVITVTELVAAYWEHVKTAYPNKNERDTQKRVLRELRALYGDTPVTEFDPIALKAVRQRFIDTGCKRSTVNHLTSRIKQCFRWGVEEGLVPALTLQGLLAVRGLRRGRSGCPESEPVRPVDTAVVEATLRQLSPTVADMVRIQRLTGMRPGEVCAMTSGEIDTRGDVWVYTPRHHKTAHHGKARVIPIGPKAKAVVAHYLRPELDRPLFSPAESEHARHESRKAGRASPMTPSHRRRAAAVKRRKRTRPPGAEYDASSYRRAIHRACDRAGVPRWSPNQLRHSFATEVRRDHGLEAAGALLGHSKLQTTQVYAERDAKLAEEVARRIG